MVPAQHCMVSNGFLFCPPGCKERPLGQPRALQPAAGVCQFLRQLVWLHASGPLSVSPGPRALQRSSVRPTQEVQRLGESVKRTTGDMDRKDRRRHPVCWPSGPVSGGQSRLHWIQVECRQGSTGSDRQTLVDCSGPYTYKYEEKRASESWRRTFK